MNLRELWLHLRINGPREIFKRLLIEVRIYLRYSTLRKLINLTRLQIQYARRDVFVNGFPFRYYVEPTNACNLRCPFCFGWQGRSERTRGMMSLATFKSLIDKIAPYAYWIDLYNRGEPFLHPDIYDMIIYAHQRRIGTRISTNLNSLGNLTPEQLVKSGLDYLVVSLDGATQETYATYRVGGNVNSVLENLRAIIECKRNLRSATPYITVRTIVMRHNEHELQHIKEIVRHLGVDNVIFTPMIVDIKSKDAERWLPTDPKFSFYDYRQRTNKVWGNLKVCPELWQRATVTWDGLVFPCCFADGEGENFGDLANDDFLSIWNNERYQVSRAVFRDPSEKPAFVTVCVTCLGSRKRR
jgi:MoaA/NifB/PqqE/SkfB family radical SAM enzyme